VTRRDRATAFAPGSVANIAVGFDLLGHSVSVVGDRVTARRVPGRAVSIRRIMGSSAGIPTESDRNTAAVAVRALAEDADVDFGCELTIEKGVPLSSGLGGSAASAVAAVMAANALLPDPREKSALLKYALAGEETAGGARHLDNVAPSLLGGLVLVVNVDPPIVRSIPVPSILRTVLVRPHMEVPTRMARSILSPTVPLRDVTRQQANLAGFIIGCHTNDLELIRETLRDVIIEPQRRQLIPGFVAVQRAAVGEGALGCSIAGAGPTVFAWCVEEQCVAVQHAMVAEFNRSGLGCDGWVSAIDSPGSNLVEDA